MYMRTCLLLTAACFASVSLLHAAEPSFAGTWKINFDKSKITGFQEKIEDLGNHEMKFSFGDDTETYYFDGKEHPTRYGSARTITTESPDKWQAVTKRDGKVASTDAWTITDGGKMLTIHSEGNHADGSSYKNELIFKRVAGVSGLAGTWESTKIDPESYPEMVIEAFEGDGLAISVPSFKEVHKVKFDGKDYPNEGPRVAPGATTSGQRIDGHTIELTDKLKGKVADTLRSELSPDGKTLTATVSYPGVEQKEVDVYDRK